MTTATRRAPQPAWLVLADGTTFEGEAFGYEPDNGVSTGEVVFNTALSGYQEIVTDPSYAGQIITFTYPHIGNYGVNETDAESAQPWCNGVIVRELARRSSNWRAEGDLDGMLREHRVPGIAGVDTRRLTKHIRSHGSLPAAFGTADVATLKQAAIDAHGTDGQDLASRVSTKTPYTVGDADAPFSVVAYDFGIKRTILRHLVGAGCRVEVVPAATAAADVLARKPDGVFLSNGPGDPEAVPVADEIARLIGDVPVFGICLGHQLLGRAIGGTTYKLPFGHHGGNHPVRDETTNTIEITSQNHNYAVDAASVESRARLTHVNLNDGVCEGLEVLDALAFSVQYHPEAGPGPHDSSYLFARFVDLMTEGA